MDNNKDKMNRILAIIIGIVLVISLSLNSIVRFITDYQWFSKNDFVETFLVKYITIILIFIPLWTVLCIALNIYLRKEKDRYVNSKKIFLDKKTHKRFNVGIVWFSAIITGLFSLNSAIGIWMHVRMFMNSTGFNDIDPIFGKNIEFYIFKLPLYQAIVGLLMSVIILSLVCVFAFFFFMISRMQSHTEEIYDFSPGGDIIEKIMEDDFLMPMVKRIAFLGMLMFLVMAASYHLRIYDLMYSTKGVAYGASYTDIHVTLKAYRFMSFVSVVSAVLFAYGFIRSRIKILAIGPIALIAVGIAFGITGMVVQQLVVEPDEINKESQYLTYNIGYTQKAFDLDKVVTTDFPVNQNIDREMLSRNEETVNNIRINDERPLRQTYNQIQGIRLYYVFNDIDLDRYMINGKYTQVFISTREIDQEKLPDQAKTWINRHLKFTHGYGIVMSPVNDVSDDGQPKLIFKNVPSVTDTDLVLDRPELYFGELTNQYAIINTEEDEFDYPSGSDNVTTRYEGTAGIELGGLNKLLFSIRERSMKLFVSTIVNSDSRIIIYRNINERVEKIAPFLRYDDNPYLVLNQEDGKLYWIIDAYTTSNRYPYSQPFIFKDRYVNYVRNSVKVVIDAYDGTTKFYVFDEKDPVVQSYSKIFPDLFTPKEKLTDGLMAHVRYPQDYFDIQSEVYRAYHVENPVVFYNGEDIWDIANEKYMDGIQKIESNYVMFKLGDSDKKEFALILPYTPREKPNMTSLLVARSDGDNYGKLYMYKFPKDKTIQGPLMIEARIDQDSQISPQFTLWGQKGSTVLRGNIIVVPIEDSLLYVEPIYLKADNPNSLPEMKRVIVAYQDKVVMEETLEEALDRIFGAEKIDIPSVSIDIEDGDKGDVERLLNEINSLFKENQDNMDKINEKIDQLNEILGD
jgi:uncharacterized membrane protein (UPF0182 family)